MFKVLDDRARCVWQKSRHVAWAETRNELRLRIFEWHDTRFISLDDKLPFCNKTISIFRAKCMHCCSWFCERGYRIYGIVCIETPTCQTRANKQICWRRDKRITIAANTSNQTIRAQGKRDNPEVKLRSLSTAFDNRVRKARSLLPKTKCKRVSMRIISLRRCTLKRIKQ